MPEAMNTHVQVKDSLLGIAFLVTCCVILASLRMTRPDIFYMITAPLFFYMSFAVLAILYRVVQFVDDVVIQRFAEERKVAMADKLKPYIERAEKAIENTWNKQEPGQQPWNDGVKDMLNEKLKKDKDKNTDQDPLADPLMKRSELDVLFKKIEKGGKMESIDSLAGLTTEASIRELNAIAIADMDPESTKRHVTLSMETVKKGLDTRKARTVEKAGATELTMPQSILEYLGYTTAKTTHTMLNVSSVPAFSGPAAAAYFKDPDLGWKIWLSRLLALSALIGLGIWYFINLKRGAGIQFKSATFGLLVGAALAWFATRFVLMGFFSLCDALVCGIGFIGYKSSASKYLSETSEYFRRLKNLKQGQSPPTPPSVENVKSTINSPSFPKAVDKDTHTYTGRVSQWLKLWLQYDAMPAWLNKYMLGKRVLALLFNFTNFPLSWTLYKLFMDRLSFVPVMEAIIVFSVVATGFDLAKVKMLRENNPHITTGPPVYTAIIGAAVWAILFVVLIAICILSFIRYGRRWLENWYIKHAVGDGTKPGSWRAKTAKLVEYSMLGWDLTKRKQSGSTMTNMTGGGDAGLIHVSFDDENAEYDIDWTDVDEDGQSGGGPGFNFDIEAIAKKLESEDVQKYMDNPVQAIVTHDLVFNTATKHPKVILSAMELPVVRDVIKNQAGDAKAVSTVKDVLRSKDIVGFFANNKDLVYRLTDKTVLSKAQEDPKSLLEDADLVKAISKSIAKQPSVLKAVFNLPVIQADPRISSNKMAKHVINAVVRSPSVITTIAENTDLLIELAKDPEQAVQNPQFLDRLLKMKDVIALAAELPFVMELRASNSILDNAIKHVLNLKPALTNMFVFGEWMTGEFKHKIKDEVDGEHKEVLLYGILPWWPMVKKVLTHGNTYTALFIVCICVILMLIFNKLDVELFEGRDPNKMTKEERKQKFDAYMTVLKWIVVSTMVIFLLKWRLSAM